MRELLHRVERTLYRASNIGGLVNQFLLGGVVLLIVLEIVRRYIFNRPIAYTVELVEMGLSIIVFLAIVVCTVERGHVNIDMLLRRFSPRSQAAINSFFYFLCAWLFGLIAWRCFVYALQLRIISQVSMMLKLPYYPFVLVMALCALLTSLVFLSQFIHFVAEAVRK